MALLTEKPVLLCRDHILCRIDAGDIETAPGQFVNIRIGDTMDPLLRRPFSVHNQKGRTIELVIQVLGKGTRWLRDHLNPGNIDVLLPLGNGFSLPKNTSALLVGGGVGNAPLYYLARALRGRGTEVTYLYGSRSIECMFLRERYKEVADVIMEATDDGSCGEKGRITDLAEKVIGKNGFTHVFTCGPTPMMRTLVDMVRGSGIEIEVSVENYFGCGVGLCSGCTVETVHGNRRACVDGPVFNGKEINWDALQGSHYDESCGA